MGRAKEIVVKVIPAKLANEFIKKYHYSGKVVNNSSLHFGCYLDNRLHGVMSYGSPLDKSKVLPLVHTAQNVPCLWNEMLELNRMAFDDYLPKYSESRCIAVPFRMIKKNAPHIKWILSFSDGTQCGDGSIYRASGFVLTQIGKNTGMYLMPDGTSEHVTVFMGGAKGGGIKKRKWGYVEGEGGNSLMKRVGAKKLCGFQLRYIYLIDKTCKITVPVLPFSKIDEMGAGMYKGENVTLESRKNKHAEIAHLGERCISNTEGAFDATVRLNKTEVE